MLDTEHMDYPMLVEAHGQRWLALDRSQTTDTYHTHIAVPRTEREPEGVTRRKEREAAEAAREEAKKRG